MNGHVFITPGDITQISAHALAYSAANTLSVHGHLFSAFEANVPGFGAWYRTLAPRDGSERPVGETYWLPLDPHLRPHGVLVVVSTGGPATLENKATLSVRAALTSAVRHLRAGPKRTERLLIALPAFRLGLGADRDARLQSARVQIQTALEILAGMSDVDAVFLAYTATTYQILLEARRQVLGGPPPSPVACPELEEALTARECVLFVGAGLSRGTGLPDWSELIARLAHDLNVNPGDRLDYFDLAQWYRERFGTDALARVLRETFHSVGRPSLAHYLLLGLPIRQVITTNYDDLIERTLAALKRYPVKVVRQQDVARTGEARGVHVVKFHGDVSHAEEIVLTRDDYEEFFERRPAMALMLEGLLLNQTFFFVGYGLRDPNFRQIYHRLGRMLRDARRPAFATTFEANGDSGTYLARQWHNQGLNLLSIPGATRAEQEQQFVRFLDYLSDQVALQSPRLLLAPDVEATGTLTRLRKILIEQVGGELEEVCLHGLLEPGARQDVPHLVEVLRFLAGHGWRPAPESGLDLCHLWEHLAGLTEEPREQRHLLDTALGAAERFEDARRLHERLSTLDRDGTPPPPA